MPTTPMARRGMVTSPHHLASQAGLAVLREGGNAIEAAIAAAAVLSVVLPHKGGLGGDGFWLIAEPGKPPVSIDGSGSTGAKVDADLYRRERQKTIPHRGGLATGTVPGLVSAWQLALDVSDQWGGGIPLERLLEDAIHYARSGYAVSQEQAEYSQHHLTALRRAAGFSETFLTRNKPPITGHSQAVPPLATTLEHLAANGLDDFYRGQVAQQLAADLKAAGSPLTAEDLARHRGMRRRPLSLATPLGSCFSSAPPTQGLASLMVLGVMQRLPAMQVRQADWMLALHIAAAHAGRIRDQHIGDPNRMSVHATTYLTDPMLDRIVDEIRNQSPAPDSTAGLERDGAWLGVVDGHGRAVSYGHSLGSAFGSGVFSSATGIVCSNQVATFTLESGHQNAQEARRKPLHSLSPSLIRLRDGRVMMWGCGLGENQPLVLAQIFSRILLAGQSLQSAVSAPRFVDGQGQLCLESGFDPLVHDALTSAGHAASASSGVIPVGQVGVICRRPDGMIEGAADPRGDGSVAGW